VRVHAGPPAILTFVSSKFVGVCLKMSIRISPATYNQSDGVTG